MEDWKPGYVSFSTSNLFDTSNLGPKKSNDPIGLKDILEGLASRASHEIENLRNARKPDEPVKQVKAILTGANGLYAMIASDVGRNLQMFFGKQFPDANEAYQEFRDWAARNRVQVVEFHVDLVPPAPERIVVKEERSAEEVIAQKIVSELKSYASWDEKMVDDGYYELVDGIRQLYRLIKTFGDIRGT